MCDSLRSEGVGDILERYLNLVTGSPAGVRVRDGWSAFAPRYALTARPSHGMYPVLAERAALREEILDAILADPQLATAAASYLGYGPDQNPKAAWGAALEQWRRERWYLVHLLPGDLERLELTESSLADALEAVKEYKDLHAPLPSRRPRQDHQGPHRDVQVCAKLLVRG